MKPSELKEIVRSIIREKKLTAAEKNKKEDIVKGMKKGGFKGDKSSLYAIATAKAKKLAEVEELGAGYTHFAVDKSTNKIVNGWEYEDTDNESIKYYSKMDLEDMFPDRKPNEFKIVTRRFLEKNGIDPSNSDNWYKYESINEVRGDELTKKIFDIGSTLKKIEQNMDFGIDQDPEIVQGLESAYNELIDVWHLINQQRKDVPGAEFFM